MILGRSAKREPRQSISGKPPIEAAALGAKPHRQRRTT
jgi:hypothetical protein